MKTEPVILGLDIGGTNFRMGLVDSLLQAHCVEVTSSRTLFDAEDTLAALARRIQAYLHEHAVDMPPALVCVGLPAVLDRARRSVLSATNFPGLAGRDIVGELTESLGLPVRIEHDAYYLLAYDIRRLRLPDSGTVIGCYFGTGLGNAMFMDGKPYLGKHGTACELGHMPVPLSDRPCSCGNQGCIEMYACGKALEHLWQQHFQDVPLGQLFLRCPENEVLQSFVRYMAAAVATEINILDPEAVVLGGGILHMAGFPRDALLQAIRSNVRRPLPGDDVALHFAEDAPECGIIGAAIEGYRWLAQNAHSVD